MTFHPLTGADCGDLDALDGASLPWRERRAAALLNRPHAADWHAARAEGLRRGFARAVGRCQTWTAARCRCGQKSAPTRCSRRVCAECAKRRQQRTFSRLREGMARELARVRAEWSAGRGRLPVGDHRRLVPRWTMVTLTLRHSGNLTADLARLRAGWDRMRAWLRRRLGRVPAFAFVVEVTEGRDGAGHVHAHVAILLPWLAWGDIRAAWAGHVDQSDASVGFSTGKQARSSPEKAASYLAKYVGKPPKTLPLDVLSSWLDASYGRRDVTCSRGLLAPTMAAACSSCGGACTPARGGGAWHLWSAMMAERAPRHEIQAVPWTDIVACVLSREKSGHSSDRLLD